MVRVAGLLLGFAVIAQAEDGKCGFQPAAYQIIRCRTQACISQHAESRGWVLNFIRAARAFEIEPANSERASQLLQLLPADQKQQEELADVLSTVCTPAGKSTTELPTSPQTLTTSRFFDRLAFLIARAVKASPADLTRLLTYSEYALNPHWSFDEAIESVCRSMPTRFRSAVQTLPKEKAEFVRNNVIEPRGCKLKFFAEAH